MNILLLILQILGIVILAVIVIACGILLLPAGVQISWKEQVTEVWLTAGPLRRRFYPPLPKKEKPESGTAKPDEPSRTEGNGPEKEGAKKQGEPKTDAEQPAKPSPKEPQSDEGDSLYENIMGNPTKYIRVLTNWAKGPGKLLLSRIKVRKVRIVWTVTADDAAATAIAYGALAVACNTAWAVLEDLVDVKAEELRLEPDFTGERRKERCFSCQITARMYIIVASIILTLWRRVKRTSAPRKRKNTAAIADAK